MFGLPCIELRDALKTRRFDNTSLYKLCISTLYVELELVDSTIV